MNSGPLKSFDFHGKVRLTVFNIQPELINGLTACFSEFVCVKKAEPAQVEVHPLTGQLFASIKLTNFKNDAKLWFDFGPDGQPLLVSGYRGTIDMVVWPGDVVRVFVADRENAADKMVDLVYLAIMAALDRKDGILFKGALVRWQGNPLVISGVSGAGKTSLLLQMLNDGWDYLADNTFLAHEGKAFDFRTKVVFHDYHTQAFSNIFQRSGLTLQSPRQLERRSQLRQWTTRHLPNYLLKSGRLSKALNPYRAHKATEIFPDLVTFRKAEPKMVLLLLVGKHLSFEPVEPELAMHQLKLMHQMAWCEFDEINRLTEVNTGKALYQFERTIRANTAGKQFFALTSPYRADAQASYKFLTKKLATTFAHVYDSSTPLKEVDA